MSKAFTREEDAGLDAPKDGARPRSRAPRTRMGVAVLRDQLLRARAEGDAARVAALEGMLSDGVVPLPADPRRAALGAEVTLRDAIGRERVVRIVTAQEVGLVPGGASPASPFAGAIVGARAGDSIEIDGIPEGGELLVVKVAWPG